MEKYIRRNTKKVIYRILDESGRILVPKEIRNLLNLELGDIVALQVIENALVVRKVNVVEITIKERKK